MTTILLAVLPVACGVNAIVSVVLCPGAMVTGREGELTEKDESDTVALTMVSGDVLRLMTVLVSCLLLPRTTVPKSMLLAVTVTAPFREVDPLLIAAQPDIVIKNRRRKRERNARSQRELRSIVLVLSCPHSRSYGGRFFCGHSGCEMH